MRFASSPTDWTPGPGRSLSAGYSRYMAWKTADGKTEADPRIGQMETLIKGLLNQRTLLDYIRHFVVFEKAKKVEPEAEYRPEGVGKDPKTGIITIETVKKIAAYHQYYAVNKAVESTQLAASLGGDRKGGVVWHTQGSGKSLSMAFYSGKLVLGLEKSRWMAEAGKYSAPPFRTGNRNDQEETFLQPRHFTAHDQASGKLPAGHASQFGLSPYLAG